MTPSGDFVLCVACRLGIACEKLLEEGKGHTLVTRPTNQAGSPGVAHGGWTASLLDGMLEHLALFIGTFTVTSSLSVEYLCPVPVERRTGGLRLDRAARGRALGCSGRAQARGHKDAVGACDGVFIERDATHFQKHEAWLSRHDGPSGAPGDG